MPHVLEITSPPEKTEEVLERIRSIEGVIGISLQRGTSIDPPGDILGVKATQRGSHRVLGALADVDLGESFSVVGAEPRHVVSPSHFDELDRETNELSWEEVGTELRKNANPSLNFLLLMALSGGIAAVGLWTNTVHIVVGAMVVAPGFQPLLRPGLQLVAGIPRMASRGGVAVVAGYAGLALAGAVTFLVLQALEPGRSAELTDRSWVRYWSTITSPAVVVAIIAGAAGAMTVTAGRAVLTAGVMIALALIPAMTITGMSVAALDLSLFGRALGRWAVDATAVLVTGTLVFGLKQGGLHRRQSLG